MFRTVDGYLKKAYSPLASWASQISSGVPELNPDFQNSLNDINLMGLESYRQKRAGNKNQPR